MQGYETMKKFEYIIIISILLLFTLGFYIEFSHREKNKDIIKREEVHLKVVDKVYLGKVNAQNWFAYDFTKNSIIISNENEYAVLPLNNIKRLDENKQNYDIFKSGANPNVSSIIQCDDCMLINNQGKIMIENTDACYTDKNTYEQVNISKKFQLTILDDNGLVDKVKYFPCNAAEYIHRTYHDDIYYTDDFKILMPVAVYGFSIGTTDKVLIENSYSYNHAWSRIHNMAASPFSMSPDMTKFAMVDEEYNKIRLYTFDNNSIKTNVLTNIKTQGKTFLFLHDTGYLSVYQEPSNKYTLYKIHDFTKPDGYTSTKVHNANYLYMNGDGKKNYDMVKGDTLYDIFVDGGVSTVSSDLKMALDDECGKEEGECDIYLLYLEPLDANEKGVENQKK